MPEHPKTESDRLVIRSIVVQCDRNAYRGDNRYRIPAVRTTVHGFQLRLTLGGSAINAAVKRTVRSRDCLQKLTVSYLVKKLH